jgi:hypothetical protein
MGYWIPVVKLFFAICGEGVVANGTAREGLLNLLATLP